MNRNQIAYFLDVAETCSINQSAANSHISPQGLSRAVAQLERETGFPLFHRTNRGMALTDAGARLVEPARRLQQAFRDYDQSVAAIAIGHNGLGLETLNLQVPPMLSVMDLLPRVLARIQAAFEDTVIEVGEINSFEMEGYARTLTPDLAKNTLMVATVPNYRMATYLRDDRFVISKLFDMPIVARMSHAHPLAGRESISRAELAQQRILCFNEPVIEEVTHRLLDEYGGPKFAFKGSIRNLVGRFPDAIAIGSDAFSGGATDAGIVRVPIQETVHVSMVAVTAAPTSPEMRLCIECVANALLSKGVEAP